MFTIKFVDIVTVRVDDKSKSVAFTRCSKGEYSQTIHVLTLFTSSLLQKQIYWSRWGSHSKSKLPFLCCRLKHTHSTPMLARQVKQCFRMRSHGKSKLPLFLCCRLKHTHSTPNVRSTVVAKLHELVSSMKTFIHTSPRNPEHDKLKSDIQRILIKHPQVVKMEDDTHQRHWTPLTQLIDCKGRCGTNGNNRLLLVKMCLQACPEAAKVQDLWNRTPLHIACGRYKHDSNRIRVARLLTEYYPQALLLGDYQGSTPMHILCNGGANPNGARDKTIQYIVKNYPDSAEQQDNGGAFALHRYAKCRLCSQETLIELVNANPTALLINASTPSNHAPLTLPCELLPRSRMMETFTLQTFTALLETVLTPFSKVDLSVKNRMVANFPFLKVQGLDGDDSKCLTGLSLWDECHKQLKFQPTLRSLLKLDLVQSLLGDDKLKGLLCGMMAMSIETDRKYIRRDPNNLKRGINTFSRVSDNLDCLLILLHENPSICGVRKQSKKRPSAQPDKQATKRQRR